MAEQQDPQVQPDVAKGQHGSTGTSALESLMEEPPKLHAGPDGQLYLGGLQRLVRPMVELIDEHVDGQAVRVLETGAGLSTLAFLAMGWQVTSVSLGRDLGDRIAKEVARLQLDEASREHLSGRSEIVLPTLADRRFDVALMDGGRGWPTVFVDFCYLNATLREGGLLLVNEADSYPVRQLVELLQAQPGYQVVRDRTKLHAFLKETDRRFLPDLGGQPYLTSMAQHWFSGPRRRPTRPVQTTRPARSTTPGGSSSSGLVTAVLTSCGRHDLLRRTLDTFFATNTGPLDGMIVVEDGPEVPPGLRHEFRDRPVEWISTGERVGQVAAIDYAYSRVTTPYIFHMEDDWDFGRSGYIERSLAVLEANPKCVQVWIRPVDQGHEHTIEPDVHEDDGVEWRIVDPEYEAYCGTDIVKWRGFSFNPGLRRLEDYVAIGGYGAHTTYDPSDPGRSEWAIGELYHQRGFFAAILADDEGSGYITHSGAGRHVGPPATPKREVLRSSGTGASVGSQQSHAGPGDRVPIAAAICTYERHDILPDAVASLREQTLTQDRFRVLVVDNSPSSARRRASRERMDGVGNVRYITVDTPGLSNARNVAARAANADVIAYMDDDAVADPRWLEEILAAFDALGDDVGIVGGRVDPLWGADRPEWLSDGMLSALTVVDHAGRLREAGPGEWLAGANFAVRSEPLLEMGGFSTKLGRVGAGDVLLSNDDTDLVQRFSDQGWKVVWAPGASVKHRIAADRLSVAWFRRRYAWQAVSDLLADADRALDLAEQQWERLHRFTDRLPPRLRTPRGLFEEVDDPDLVPIQVAVSYGVTVLLLAGYVPPEPDVD